KHIIDENFIKNLSKDKRKHKWVVVNNNKKKLVVEKLEKEVLVKYYKPNKDKENEAPLLFKAKSTIENQK
ncbi:284_t:CDS:1, partial [Gigaspora margarita]